MGATRLTLEKPTHSDHDVHMTFLWMNQCLLRQNDSHVQEKKKMVTL